MYSIGEFSKISSLSVKALRLYHEKEILVPGYVDRSSGYRYYSKRDIEKARAVLYLKELTFSLSEIRQILADYSDESEKTEFFEQKRNAVLGQANHLRSVSKKIDILLEKELEIKNMDNIQEFAIEKKELDPILVLASRWRGRYEESGKAFSKLYRAAGRHPTGTALNLFYDGEYKEDDADVETCVPLKKEINGKAFEVKELSSGPCVSIIHKGPYSEIGRSYKLLFDHIKKIGKHAQVPSREIYVKGPGMIFKGNPEKYLTEIQIPIN